MGLNLKIPKNAFKTDKFDKVEINSATTVKNIHQGTQVILSRFSKAIWQEISLDDIKKAIGEHFDGLVRRKNFTITVNQEKVTAYNYDSIGGEVWEEEIKEAKYTPKKQGVGKLSPVKVTFPKPIKIFLKMSDKLEVNRPPVFIVKGRRINDIKSIKGFKSFYSSKTILWGHPQITGYIDLQDNFEPTITRDNFREIRSDKFKAFNQQLNELEQLIYVAFITDKNKEKADNTFNSLASEISDIMSNLAKEDVLQLNTVNLSKEGDGYPFEEGLGTKDRGSKRQGGKGGSNIGINEGDGIGANIDEVGNDLFDDIQNPKKRSGLDITFTDEELIQLENSKDYLRSQLIEDINGKTIKIYRKHNDFTSRIRINRKAEVKIKENLLHYISCEIAIHYKDELYSKSGNRPDKYEKEIFRDITNLIYKIERKLAPLTEHSLSVLDS